MSAPVEGPDALSRRVPSHYKIEGYPAVDLIAQSLIEAGFWPVRAYEDTIKKRYERATGKNVASDRFMEVWTNGGAEVVFEVWPRDRYCEVYRVVKETLSTQVLVDALRQLGKDARKEASDDHEAGVGSGGG